MNKKLKVVALKHRKKTKKAKQKVKESRAKANKKAE
jgi:hypothetical protein